jgi:predicted ATPase
LAFGNDKKRRCVVREERAWHGEALVMDRPTPEDKADPERLRQTALEQVAANVQFRQIPQFFESIQYRHIVPQLVREVGSWEEDFADPYGQDVVERMLRTGKKSREARLRRIQRALAFAVPQLKELRVERDDSGRAHLRGRYEHWRPHGAWQTEAEFSDGTLRLLGLLWALLDGEGPLLLEEPELSLHPQVVRYIPQLMARVQARQPRRQILLSTHSPDLLYDHGIAPEEVLLFIPSDEGTRVTCGGDYEDVRALLQQGLSLSETILPKVEPAGVSQLALF